MVILSSGGLACSASTASIISGSIAWARQSRRSRASVLTLSPPRPSSTRYPLHGAVVARSPRLQGVVSPGAA